MGSGRATRLRGAALSAGAAVLLSACSGVSIAPVGGTSSGGASPSGTPAPTSATATRTPAAPDATVADLLHVTLPTYCELPESTLVGGRSGSRLAPATPTATGPGSASHEPSGEPSTDAGSRTATSEHGAPSSTTGASRRAPGGEIVLDGPTAPVAAPIGADGEKLILGEYRCDAGGTTWPSMLVLARHGGDVAGTVRLGDIARTPHARVTSWQPTTGGVLVRWVATGEQGADARPYEHVLGLSGPTLTFTPTERGKRLAQTTVVPEGADFVTPTGQIACRLDGAGVTCATRGHELVVTGQQCSGKVDGVALTAGQPAYACTGGEPFLRTRRPQGWHREGSDPTVQGQPGLAFGRTLTTGQVTCTTATTGVTCTDVLTGRGFTLSDADARLF